MSPTRETRFAVVMNGGVSLAVWMGGVTHELNRLRLASAGEMAEPGDEAEGVVHETWGKILEAVSGRAVIDTIAGTSAGGINGTLLAAAIAGGKDLPAMKARWSQLAALKPEALLGASDKPLKSLLDGKFFYDQVRHLLTDVAEGDLIAEPSDCVLLVTSTAIDVRPVPIRLEGGAQATVVDSRRVYRFERRDDGEEDLIKNDFAVAADSIALASRASASFPVAFEPVWESNSLREFRESALGEPQSSWLIDGGVLDNAPFGPLMEVLQARPVGAPFDRVLLYVTPSPGVTGSSDSLGSSPSALQVLGRVISTAREPDQRLDFEGLRDAFQQMGFTRATAHEAITRLLQSTEPSVKTQDAVQAAQNWFTTYQFSRTEAVERWLSSLGGNLQLAKPVPPQLKPGDLASVPPVLDYPQEQWGWGVATAERVLRWWGRALVDCFDPDSGVITEETFATLEASQRRVSRLSDQLGPHMALNLEAAPQDRARHLNAFYTPRPGDTKPDVRASLREAVEATANAIAQLELPGQLSAEDLIRFTLAVEVISSVLAWGDNSEGDAPRFRYRQITPAAESIIDIGEVANDANWLNRKLYGERWGHFGAFLSEDGRQADWLWGRLDGASALCDYLLESVDAEERLKLKNTLADAILAAEGSSREKLKEAAATANEARNPKDLLHKMKQADRQVMIQILWDRASKIIGDADATGSRRLTATQALRAFADPTWTKNDLPETATLTTRVKTRLIRWYGAPARFLARRPVNRSLGI